MITLVSGVPRSGTSLMMRILAESGVPVVSDETMSYELAATASLTADPKTKTWVYELEPGSVVKVLYPDIQYMPGDVDFRIIWMSRNARECASSQYQLLDREERNYVYRQAKYIRQVNENVPWRLKREYPLVVVWFGALVRDPYRAVQPVEDLLNTRLDPRCVKDRDGKHSGLPLGTLETTPTEEINAAND